MIKCIIFDLDGVLCDLVEAHRNAFDDALAMVSDYKIPEKEFWKYYNGLPTNTKLDMLINRGIIKPEDKDVIWSIKQAKTTKRIENDLEIDYKKIQLHKYLKINNYTLACVSNATLATVTRSLAITGQYEYMDLLLGNESFDNKPKPDPYCYDLAMKRLNMEKKKVLIVEDSDKGIRAARYSGAHVWEVENAKEVTKNNITKVLNKLNKEN